MQRKESQIDDAEYTIRPTGQPERIAVDFARRDLQSALAVQLTYDTHISSLHVSNSRCLADQTSNAPKSLFEDLCRRLLVDLNRRRLRATVERVSVMLHVSSPSECPWGGN